MLVSSLPCLTSYTWGLRAPALSGKMNRSIIFHKITYKFYFILSVLTGHVKDNKGIRPSQQGIQERQVLLDQPDLLL